MRCDEYRAAPEGAQMQAPGWGDPGERSLRRFEAWADENPRTWDFMVRHARRLARRNGYFSVKYLVEMARNERGARIPNADSAAAGRVLRSRCPDLAPFMRTRAARCDGFQPAAAGEGA